MVKDLPLVFKAILASAKIELYKISEEEVTLKSSPKKWSKLEILGHLIDSAMINNERFTNFKTNKSMIFIPYDQDELVKANEYQKASWKSLIEKWFAENITFLNTIQDFSPEEFVTPHTQHNLHRVAFKTKPKDQPVNMLYFTIDYLAHMEHHLLQILPSYQQILK